MRIALALGLNPIVLTTLVAPRPPEDSTRESYPARPNDHVLMDQGRQRITSLKYA